MTVRRRRDVGVGLVGAALAFALLGAWWPGSAAAAVIKAGKERAVLDLLLPYEDGGAVGDAAIIKGIAISQDKIAVFLQSAAAQTATAQVILRPLSRVQMTASGKSFQTQVKLDGGSPSDREALAAAAKLVEEAVHSNDDGTFFDEVAMAQTPTATHRPDTEKARKAPENPGFSLWNQQGSKVAVAAWGLLIVSLLAALARLLVGIVRGPGRLRLCLLAVLR